MKVYEDPSTLAENDSNIKIEACTKIPRSFVTRLCAYNGLRYKVRVYRTISPLFFQKFGQNLNVISVFHKSPYCLSS